ncbi:primase-like DNA-binding domain-containing protein, partial [Kitasatospora sp. HPMI-4]|uniref:primase-like DNA-binding domain-containing protein n=1 Tax=Kitasatospora sp. HPMI-4 TaxID=3448443 RepID=UPI003F19D7A0
LLLLQFPFKFLKPGQEPKGPNERVGDPGLRVRLKQGKQQRAAVLAWLVEGATRWYQADRVMPQPPTHVVEATRKWRKQSDLILSYWDNMIEADPNSHVMARDLFDAFNAWLTERGHAKWADKTFVARFEGHDETSGNAVERRKIRQKPNLSRPALVTSMLQPPAVPATYWAWVGVRFVVDGVKMDDAEDM